MIDYEIEATAKIGRIACMYMDARMETLRLKKISKENRKECELINTEYISGHICPIVCDMDDMGYRGYEVCDSCLSNKANSSRVKISQNKTVSLKLRMYAAIKEYKNILHKNNKTP